MPDETTATAPAADAGTPPAQDAKPAQDGDATGKQAEQAGRTFTQVELDAFVKERLDRADRKAAEATAKARAEEQRKAAEAQGEYEKLYKAAQAELESTQARARALELAAMRRDVAAKTGLPAALAERLQGDTPEALEADAKIILAALPKPAAPNLNSTGGAPPPAGDVSEEYRREMAARFGVNEKYFQVKGV